MSNYWKPEMSSSENDPTAGQTETPWSTPNGIEETYDMHCHCGAIRYKMTLSPPLYAEQTQGKEQCVANQCHCSNCLRNGLLAVHPLARNVEFTQGLEHRVDYYTGTKKNPYWFCSKCGSVLGMDLTYVMREIFHDEPRYTINTRMLKDFDPTRIKSRELTFMRDFGPKYEIS